MTRRVFPIAEWAPTQEPESPNHPSTYVSSNESYDIRDSSSTFTFRERLRSLPLGTDLNFVEGLRNMSLGSGDKEKAIDDGKRGGIRGLFRRASVNLKAKRDRRQSHAFEDQPRPPTSSSPWLHRLRGAASFNRHSRFLPPQFENEGLVDSCEELLAPIPGIGAAPPIIPRGSGGAAARATAAAQNEYFGRRRLLLSAEDQLEDRESGIGISLATTEPMQYFDSSISRVDFISLLPAELSIQILAHLDHHTLLSTSLVSKSWAQISGSHHVWREAFLREKSKTYAMSQPVRPGTGLGLPNYTPENDWKELYRVRQQLEHNWREGKAEPVYLNGHLDSIYCVQFDE